MMDDAERIAALEAKVAELEKKLDRLAKETITPKTLPALLKGATLDARRRSGKF
jgi:hypothetical protein